jgi:quercetin dioxygenase-like cupin family protein
VSANRGESAGRPLRPSPVLPADQRAVLDMDTGVRWERLTPHAEAAVDALLVTYQPGSRSSSSGTLMTHSGVEYAYLISGELTVHLGFETYVIHAGESLTFDSAHPHMYANDSEEPAVGVWYVFGRDQAHGPRDRIETAVDVLETFGRLESHV